MLVAIQKLVFTMYFIFINYLNLQNEAQLAGC